MCLQAPGAITAPTSLTGVKLDSLQSNGQRLLKLPGQTTLPKIKGITLTDPTSQVR